MNRSAIAPEDLRVDASSLWLDQWLLLAAGDFKAGSFNAMTVAWGGLGGFWSRPVAFVAVRPNRYTFEFMERSASFTLSAFPETQRNALDILGRQSGRDSNKIAESGLTPEAASSVAAPAFSEAELLIECKTIAYQDLDPERFLAHDIAGNYPDNQYHRLYIGEILAACGTDAYRR